MTTAADDTRDDTPKLDCPKCGAWMESVAFGGAVVNRCVSCKGLWFDAREHEHLKEVEGSEVIDTPKSAKAVGKVAGKIKCPVCHTQMIEMTDHQQPHLKFESCTVCYGAFFDAGEFTDYKDVTLVESIKRLFR